MGWCSAAKCVCVPRRPVFRECAESRIGGFVSRTALDELRAAFDQRSVDLQEASHSQLPRGIRRYEMRPRSLAHVSDDSQIATSPGIVSGIVGISSYTPPGPAIFTC